MRKSAAEIRKSNAAIALQERRSTIVQEPKGRQFTENDYKTLDRASQQFHKKLHKRYAANESGLLTRKQDERDVLEKRLEDNEVALRLAYEHGLEFIKNIQLTNENRLFVRKEFENKCDDDVEELFTAKESECTAQFDEIAERFSNTRLIADDPKQLPEALAIQKRHIAALLRNKDDCIEKLRSEYQRLDEDYDSTIHKQKNDMHFLYIRMNAHLEAMRASYTQYLQLLQDSIDAERETLNLTLRRKWTELHDRVDENLLMKHNVEREKKAFYDAQLERIRLEHTELTRAARIQLERDEQSVHLELQELRASTMLNGEKFDYNYQILQKKGDENVTVRNQQKRKLAQMREQAVGLRKEIDEIKANFEQASAKCTSEVVRFHSSFMELETRADRYARINDKKFENVWTMNEEEATAVLKRVLAIDKVLFEQQLGLAWPQPSLMPLHKEDLYSYRTAVETLYTPDAEDNSSSGYNQSVDSIGSLPKLSIPPSKSNFQEQMLADTRVLRIILRQITEETDFLVEEKLMALLRPYLQPVSTAIVEVDNVFQALGVLSMRDVSTLIDHFVPYAWCTRCSLPHDLQDDNAKDAVAAPASSADKKRASEKHLGSMMRRTVANLVKETLSPGRTSEFLDPELASYIQDIEKANQADLHTRQSCYPSPADTLAVLAGAGAGAAAGGSRRPTTPCERHNLVIETGCVLRVFREYARTCLNARTKVAVGGIGASTEATTMADRLACVRRTVSRLLSADDVEAFWRRFREVFTEERHRLWEALELGLKEYLRVLQRRDRLNGECEYLRRQNAELRHMLQPYLDSRK